MAAAAVQAEAEAWEEAPVTALKPSTRAVLASMLNAPKVLPTDDGLPRDWRGLSHLLDLPPHARPHAALADPAGALLDAWPRGSLRQLRDCLRRMDRWDVLQDTHKMMDADATVYMENRERVSTSAVAVSDDLESQILTRDDVMRLEQGLPPQHYNAYLLYADADESFALQIIQEMEQKYNLKLCVRDRDIVGGHMFEHEAIMRLISQRCNRLVVVISENFLRSEANKFFCTFAQALGIDQKRRMVIPVMHQPCRLPPELNFFFVLDYTRSGQLWDFWKKLRDSIETPASRDERPLRMFAPTAPPRSSRRPAPRLAPQPASLTPATVGGSGEAISAHDKAVAVSPAEARGMVETEARTEVADANADAEAEVEAGSLKKGARSLSLESLKARSRKFFSAFPQRHKKSKKGAAQPVLC